MNRADVALEADAPIPATGTAPGPVRRMRDAVRDRLSGLDARLVAPGPAWRARWVHALLSAVICWRLLTRDWALIADRPDALRYRYNIVGWIPELPAEALVAIQVIGVLAAILAIGRVRPRLAFAVAWIAYTVLTGLWGSSGKFMHNDVLTVTVGAVMLAAAVPARGTPRHERAVCWGWPPRAALAVVGLVYFLTGAQKLRHSGFGWAFGDNMEWVLRGGHSPFGDAFTTAIVDVPVLPQLLATGALALELLAPLLLLVHWTRLPFAAAVAVMHTSIWACLGLDYSAWILTVAAVAVPMGLPWRIPWRRVTARRARRAPHR